MNKRKIFFDVIFIVTTTSILIVLNETTTIEKYIGYAPIPLAMAYYLGQFVERKTKK